MTTHLKRFWKSEKGQTSIFIALLFQALFVLFAMAINVGMVVHDKINLQNSVDLAAYYAGQRQAEWLNVIAHTNYQIRQAFKLLAFRYKVMGTMGMNGYSGGPQHPTYNPTNLNENGPWGNISGPSLAFAQKPYACVHHVRNWDVVGTNTNLCRVASGSYIPGIPTTPNVAPFTAINAVTSAISSAVQQRLKSTCGEAGAYSWFFAAAAVQSFREEQRNRIELINQYALILAEEDAKDIYGDLISLGARKTLEKNLTTGNRDGFDPSNFEVFNSLQGQTREDWLSKVLIFPFVAYMDIELVDVNSDGSLDCTGGPKPVNILPQLADAKNIINSPTGLDASELYTHMTNLNSFDGDIGSRQFSLGVEKNPWVMAYMGVRAQVTSRPIFFPYGEGITLTAEAYAKPFGGRIGPWYGRLWPPAATMSEGPRTDPMVPARGSPAGTFLTAGDNSRIADYSKYPGDQFGLTSFLASNAFQQMARQKFRILDYYYVWRDILPDPNSWDKMAWNLRNGTPGDSGNARPYEISAIAPDLFDVTYYSIMPDFHDNYLTHIKAAAQAGKLPIDTNVPLRGDMGARPGLSDGFSVINQIETAKTQTPPDTSGSIAPRVWANEAFYFIKDPAHLLTGWVKGVNIGAPDNNSSIPAEFGACAQTSADAGFKVPGACVAEGGVTGYSVKLVNKNALTEGEWELGGPGQKAPIRNKPSW